MADYQDKSQDVTDANGDIYEEITPVPPVRRTAKFTTKYDTLPPLNKLRSYSKDDLNSPIQETDESKDRHKRGFSEKITKKMNQMKHKVIRHISDQGCNHGNAADVIEERKKHLYRSRSTDDLLSIGAPYDVSFVPVPLPRSVDDKLISPDNFHIYDHPRPMRPALPIRKTKCESRDYVNTLLARATVSPMREARATASPMREARATVSPMREAIPTVSPMREARATVSPMRGGKTDVLSTDTSDSNIYETVYDAGNVSNKELYVEEVYSKIELGKEDGFKGTVKCTPEWKQSVTTPPKSKEFHQSDASIKCEDFCNDMYVEMDVSKEPRNDKLDHKIEDQTLKMSNEVKRLAATAIRRMTIDDIGEQLKELRLEAYIQLFKENQVDGMILANLKADDFVQELGMKKLEAVRLYTFVESGHIPK